MKTKSSDFRYLFSVFLIIFFTLGIGFAAGYFLGSRQISSVTKYQFPLFEHAYELLVQHGFYPLPDQRKIEYGIIRGLLQAYNDPYTILVEPPQHELQSQQLRGNFGGIGARIDRDIQNRYRLFPFENSPAFVAGVRDGDILLAIDDIEINPETPQDDVISLLRGDKGTTVRLLIFREADQTEYRFQIIREEIALPSVTWNLLPENDSIGYIQINLMASTTPEEIQKAIEDLRSQGSTAFILDLRNNGGGLVDTGVKIAQLFLPAGSPILTQTYRDKEPKTIRAEKDGPFVHPPLVILINHSTASAAEITAGALKAQQRAVLIGSPTFGKYTIQLVFDMQDGSSLHITAAEWEIPGLQPPVRDHGVLPDIWIENETSDNLQSRYIQAAIQSLQPNISP
ncbi:MAG: S41 family peptidase [Chloroflexota bacterium]|nr:MAG: carboxyl-terminal processing protease [Bellilinea sp.]